MCVGFYKSIDVTTTCESLKISVKRRRIKGEEKICLKLTQWI